MAVRRYRSGDEKAMYDVCLRTGAAGEDATDLYVDPDLLGAVYVGPYVAFEPGLAFVVDDGAGAQGYVLGARDTEAFEQTCRERWWPSLCSRYPLNTFAPESPDAQLVRLIHDPPVTPPSVRRDHPSHLHIDLLPRWQGGGWGRRLIETLIVALEAAGSRGLHLGVATANTRAVGFYERLGFSVLERGKSMQWMGRALGARALRFDLGAHRD